MFSVKAAKDELGRSVTNYKQNKSALERLLTDNTNNNTKTISRKLTAFRNALSALNDSHTSWVSKAGFDDTALAAETYSEEWLQQVWNTSDNLCDRAEDAIQLHHIT